MTARVTISLPDDLLAQLDSVAESELLTRSDVVREAAASYLTARAMGSEASLRLQAVEDGIAWLRRVAEEPSGDARPGLELLRELRADAGGVERGTDAPADSGNRE